MFHQLDTVIKDTHVKMSIQYVVKVIMTYLPHPASYNLGVYLSLGSLTTFQSASISSFPNLSSIVLSEK